MLLRYATPADKPPVRQLWEAAFSADGPAYTDWYFQQVYCAERTLCAFDDTARMVACLQIAPYRLQLDGSVYPAAYLVGVTTAADFRHRGIGHRLLRRALTDLRQQGCRLVLLNTDKPGFYTPLGFCYCYFLRHLRFSAQSLPAASDWRDSGRSDADIMHYDCIYRQMCGEYRGYILRSKADWQKFLADHLTDRSSHLCCSSDGYALWSIQEQQLVVRELGFADADALNRALLYLRSTAARSGLREVIWDAPQSAPLPAQAQEKPLPYVMARSLEHPADTDASLAAQATQAWLGAPDPQLWISEIT